MTFQEALPIILPILVLQLILAIVALWDLTRPERRVKGSNKWVWAIVVVFGGIIGPLVYLFVAREDY
ncbi:MAG TPA: PLD nuclease N-terminal domain-containing protein [Candidatus Limnocylindria bacterium]|nr:PLD nuclease N-terminal domain-containing protein [Candidatus Limnocylindria bacterium]